MKEREILQKIKDFVQEFDRRAGRAVKKVVLPATLGMGLALAPGCGAPDDADQGRAKTTQARGKADGPDGGMVALYAAPFPGQDAGVPGPQPEYAAPFPQQGSCVGHCGTSAGVPSGSGNCYCDDLCSDPQYNDCCDDKAQVCDDGGAVALYAAPFPSPDAGVPGPQPEYAAPFPDQGSCVDHCGSSTAVPNGSGSCYCDDACSMPQYNDCCEDKADVCDTVNALYAAPFPAEDPD